MAKPEWGTKRTCPECGTRFYDLDSTPVTCVSCETSFEPVTLLKSRRVKPEEEKKVAKPAAAEESTDQTDSELAALKAEGVDVDDADEFEDDDNIESLDSLDEEVAAPETMVDGAKSSTDGD